MAIKSIIVVFLAYLNAFVFAHGKCFHLALQATHLTPIGPMGGEPKESGNGRSLLNLLAGK